MNNNASIYGLVEKRQFQVIESDFLRLESYKDILEKADEQNTNLIRFPTENK